MNQLWIWLPTVISKADYSQLVASCVILSKFIPWTSEVNGLKFPTFLVHSPDRFLLAQILIIMSCWQQRRSPAAFCIRVENFSWRCPHLGLYPLWDRISKHWGFIQCQNTKHTLQSGIIFSLCIPEQSNTQDLQFGSRGAEITVQKNNNLTRGPV